MPPPTYLATPYRPDVYALPPAKRRSILSGPVGVVLVLAAVLVAGDRALGTVVRPHSNVEMNRFVTGYNALTANHDANLRRILNGVGSPLKGKKSETAFLAGMRRGDAREGELLRQLQLLDAPPEAQPLLESTKAYVRANRDFFHEAGAEFAAHDLRRFQAAGKRNLGEIDRIAARVAKERDEFNAKYFNQGGGLH